MKKGLLVCFVFALLAVTALPAAADSIVTFSPSNGCGGSTCFGNTFQLTIHPTGNTYDVTLSVNTSGNTNPGSAIAAVDFKFGGGITGGTLTSFDGGAATGWNSGLGTLNANSGCNYNANGSFECALDSAFQGLSSSSGSVNGMAYLTPASIHTWAWTGVTSVGPIDPDLVHIGALFGEVDATTTTNKVCTGSGRNKSCTNVTTTTYSFKQTGNLSGSGAPTTTPEPASMVLIFAGLAGTAAWRRRK